MKRRPPRPAPPTGPAAGYARALAALLAPLDAAASEVLRGAGLRADAQGDAPAVRVPREVVQAARKAMARAARALLASRGLDETVLRALRGADAHSRAQWSAQARALGLKVASDDLVLAARVQAFRRENLALIRSLCAEHVVRVGRVLREQSGERVEDLARALREATGASRSRAELIARDQVLKANGLLTRDRHEAAGITSYTWRTSRDERVRSRHRALEGTVHRYDAPPVVDPGTQRRAHPGQDFQCRCTAEPVLPPSRT